MSCITLLSDFGLLDGTVASVKGILQLYVPKISVIDISHQIEPFHLQQAAYLLSTTYQNFPVRTCHFVLFDVYSEMEPTMILCEVDEHYFIAPDNGILSLAFEGKDIQAKKCFQLTKGQAFKYWTHFACNLIKELQIHSFEQIALPLCTLNAAPHQWQLKIDPNFLEIHVIHIDRYGNVITNLTKELFEEVRNGRNFKIELRRSNIITEIGQHYLEVKDGECLARFNDANYLEFALRKGDASKLLGLSLYNPQHLIYSSIKIVFV